jgi:hypothetical protein
MSQDANSPSPFRFKIASQMGGFRDIQPFADPLGTGAIFHLRRYTSSSLKNWRKKAAETNPLVVAYLEELVLGSRDTDDRTDRAELAAEITKLKAEIAEIGTRMTQADLTGPNPGTSTSPDAPLLTDDEIQNVSIYRRVCRKVVESGKMTVFEVLRNQDDQADREALAILSHWESMPDDNGAMISFSPESAQALLSVDAPIEKNYALDKLALYDPDPTDHARDEWTIGGFYARFFHLASRKSDLFRAQLIEGAAKNSAASSETAN